MTRKFKSTQHVVLYGHGWVIRKKPGERRWKKWRTIMHWQKKRESYRKCTETSEKYHGVYCTRTVIQMDMATLPQQPMHIGQLVLTLSIHCIWNNSSVMYFYSSWESYKNITDIFYVTGQMYGAQVFFPAMYYCMITSQCSSIRRCSSVYPQMKPWQQCQV